MSQYFIPVARAAAFDAEHYIKADLASGTSLFVGLNCFEAGQAQAVHAHRGADKFYLVLQGKARMRVADDVQVAGPGTLVWAPADVPHGVEEALERTILLVGIAPPPSRG